jgi:hypothetical protein
MPDDHTPKHLRGLPDDLDLSPEEERELMDLRTDLDRVRRKVASEQESGKEPWGFPVPRPMALLFDRLPSPFNQQEAVAEGEALGLDASDVAEALEVMRRHELVSDAPTGFVKHPEAKNWF